MIALGIRRDRSPGYLLKLFYEPLILRIMDMAVEHICPGIPVFIQAVLPVITYDWVMAQYHLSPIVVHLFIGLYPRKTSHIHSGFGHKTVMVALD